jgi:adenylosuccinate lyase
MIPRYESKEIQAIFSDVHRMRLWRDVELAVLEALAEDGLLGVDEAAELVAAAPAIDEGFVARVAERELVTNHDLAAFVDVLQASTAVPASRYLHFGLTSSDVVDTALSLQLREALAVVKGAVDELLLVLRAQAERYRATPMLGRTHGMAAEPTTFGTKLALLALAVDRARARLVRAEEAISVGKLSGAVGTYSNISPEVEARALGRLGLHPTPATQVIPRDRHAEVVFALASLATVIESFALEVRHLARTEVREVAEPFAPGQKGSSAMPHKRNPILSERLCGMARLARAALIPALEDVPLWHERDISHSSVERMLFPDLFGVVYYLVTRATGLARDLVVDAERMQANLDATHGLIYSQSILLAMVRAGLARDDAYRIVQDASSRVAAEGVELADAVRDDPRCPLSPEELAELTSLERLLGNLEPIFAALDAAVSPS